MSVYCTPTRPGLGAQGSKMFVKVGPVWLAWDICLPGVLGDLVSSPLKSQSLQLWETQGGVRPSVKAVNPEQGCSACHGSWEQDPGLLEIKPRPGS